MTREKWIDNAKGIAIILVILGHVDSRWEFAHGFHLVVFFVLSGYTFRTGPITREYVNNKFSRLMKPYFFTCFAVLLMDIFNSFFLYKHRSIIDITGIISKDIVRSFFASGTITNFGSIEIGTRIGAVWFLPALLFALLSFRFISYYIKSDLIIVTITVIASLIAYITARFIWLPFSVQSGIFALPFICTGYLTKKFGILDYIKWPHIVISIGLLIAGIYYNVCAMYFVVAYPMDIILSPIVGLAGSIIVFMLSKYYKGPVMDYLGKISLTILCVHLFALETMLPIFNYIFDIYKLEGLVRQVAVDCTHVIFAVAISIAIELLKDFANNRRTCRMTYDGRDTSFDVAKGLLIISMLVGHYSIDGNLRAIIYSCHMIAFIVFSGFFYISSRSTLDTLKRTSKTFLIPYFIAACAFAVVSYDLWSVEFFKTTFIRYIMGMSLSKRLFTGIESVGPIYFIMLLFLSRLLFTLVDNAIKSEKMKWSAVFAMSILGVALGKYGIWLPWSLDIALYGVLFYRIGYLFKERNVLKELYDNSIFYFLLAPVWAYMIYSGSMEIAIRNYGPYGLVIIGSVAGTMLVWMLSKYISDNMKYIKELLAICGRCTVYILIIHTVFGSMIGGAVSYIFDPIGFPYMVSTIVLQLVASIVIYGIINNAKIRRGR